MNKQVFSKTGSLIKQDIIRIGKGFLLALGGASIAFLGDVSGLIDYSKYGEYGTSAALAVSFLASVLINIIRKLMANTTYLR